MPGGSVTSGMEPHVQESFFAKDHSCRLPGHPSLFHRERSSSRQGTRPFHQCLGRPIWCVSCPDVQCAARELESQPGLDQQSRSCLGCVSLGALGEPRGGARGAARGTGPAHAASRSRHHGVGSRASLSDSSLRNVDSSPGCLGPQKRSSFLDVSAFVGCESKCEVPCHSGIQNLRLRDGIQT